MGTTHDAEAFDAFYRAEWGRLAGTLRLLDGRAPRSGGLAADDIAQEAMIRAWVHWSKVSRLDRPAGWLYVTAFRLQRRRLRREANRPWPDPVPEASLDVAGARSADRLAIEDALRALPLRARQAVVARHVLGLDGPEAAALLGVSPDGFRQILSRAMRSLRASPELVEEP